MPKNNKFTPQAQRIIDFVELTGLTQTQFSIQCGFKSPSTMQTICTDGQSPTTKTLSKIVHRFPQLNYDWVLMGIGEMINKAFAKAPSSTSSQRSTRATFDQIQKNQLVNDLKTNELKSDVADLMKLMKDTMILTAQQNGMLTIKIQEMSVAIIEAKKEEDIRIERLDKERKKFMEEGYKSLVEIIKSELDNNHKKSEKMVTDFDHQRKKINQTRFEQQTLEILTCLANGKKSQAKLMNEKIDKGVIMVNDAMHKNAINQTEYAINYLTEKFSPKKLFPKLGTHTTNKKS